MDDEPDPETAFPGWVSHHLKSAEIGTDARFVLLPHVTNCQFIVMIEKVAPEKSVEQS